MRYHLILLAVICLSTPGNAQVIDPAFQTSVTIAALPARAVTFADGKYILYGDFSYANGMLHRGIVRYNADGSVDNTFSIGVGPNGEVSTIDVQADGKLLVGGRFTTFSGQPRAALVRLMADGSIDQSFNPKFELQNTMGSMKVKALANGKILFYSYFSTIEGNPATHSLIRLNSNGSLDNSFTASVTYIDNIEIQSTGKIIVTGYFTKGITRLNADGSADPTFDVGSGFNGTVNSMVLAAGDAIIVGGNFSQFNGNAQSYLVGLTADGLVDASFQGSSKLNNGVSAIAKLPDGKLLIGGGFTIYNVTSINRVIRLNANGTLDGTFSAGTGPNSNASHVVLFPSGDILVTGSFTSFNATTRNGIATLTSAGAVKSMTEVAKLQQIVNVNVVVPQGEKLLVAHTGTSFNGQPSKGFDRILANGTTDATFQGNNKNDNTVSTIALDANGKILIGGFFTAYNATAVNRIARLSADGVLDGTFNIGTGFNGGVYTIKVLSDGKIMVGGAFTSFNGTNRKYLVRLNSNGSLDATFNSGNIFAASSAAIISKLLVQSDGKILVSGSFDNVAGNAIKSFVRLNADGTLDNTFLIGNGLTETINNEVSPLTGIEILDNGKILIAGDFDKVNGIYSRSIARLNADGTLSSDESDYSTLWGIDNIYKTADGKIIVADRGPGITRLNADGTIDHTFRAIDTQGFVYTMAQQGNSLVVGGTLPQIDGYDMPGLTRIILAPKSGDPSDLKVTAVTSSSISLSWADNSTNETGFEVYRSLSTGLFELVQTLGSNTTTYTNSTLPANTRFNYYVKAVITGDATAFSNKVSQTTLPGEWSSLSSTTPLRSDGVASVANGKAYIGLGKNGTGLLKDWWEFNPEGNVWTQKLDFPGAARIGAVAFSANGKIYVGTGNDQSGSGFKRDFYEYDPALNTWTPKADFPEDFNSSAGITSGVAFSVSNIGYVGLGNTGVSNTKAFFKYDPATNAWTSIAQFAGPGRTSAIAFASATRGYVGFGSGGLDPNRNDLWEYDPITNSWLQKSSSIGTGRSGATATVLNGVAYVLGGIENTTGFGGTEVYTNTSFAYDIITNSWSTKSAIPADVRSDAVAFTIGGTAYVHSGFRYSAGNIYLADLHSITSPGALLVAAPSNMVASYSSTASIRLTWKDNSNNETGFETEYSVGDADHFVPLINFTSIGPTELSHNSLQAETKYFYRVYAKNEYYRSAYSNVTSLTTTPPPNVAAALKAEGNSNSEIKLTWTDQSNNETGFEIYRSEGTNQNYTLLQTVAANSTLYTDINVNPSANYFYKVRSVNAGGSYGFSNEQNPPPAPGTLAVQTLTTDGVTLTWADNSTNETGFSLYRSVNDNSGYSLVATYGANTTTATVNSLGRSTTYFFKVQANNGDAKSLFSNEISQATLPYAPLMPTELTVASRTATTVTLTWKDNSQNETSFEVMRALQAPNLVFEVAGTVPANTTTFTDSGLIPATNYQYYVRAVNAGGATLSSTVNTTTEMPAPQAPASLSLQVFSDHRIRLNWTDNSTTETGFEIHRAIGNEDDYQLVQTVGANVKTFDDAAVNPGITYFYKVRAINTGGPSEFTASVNTLITGIETPGFTDISVYPNPVTERVNVRNYSSKAIEVTIYTTAGTLVAKEKIDAQQEKQIDCTSWQKSLYVMKANDRAGVMKIVKK